MSTPADAVFDPDAFLGNSTPAPAPFDPDAHLHAVATGNSPIQYSPTEGMSNYDLAMAGAGKAVVDLGRGVKQILQVPGAQAQIDEAAKYDRPLMKTGAGLVGDIGGNVAMAVLPAGVAAEGAGALGMGRTAAALSGIANPSTLGAAAASGAAQGALAPVETGGSRTLNTIVGGALGPLGTVMARGVSAIAAPVAEAAGKAVQALTDAGVPLDAAQRTGSILLQRAKAMLSDNPLTAGAQADFQQMQSKAFTRAALSTIGETANAATPDVMSRAMSRMGSTYDDVASRTKIPYDIIEPKLADIENQARLTLNDSQYGVVQRNLNDIIQKASQNGGSIDGPQFSNIKKTMDSLSSGADSDVGEVARDIRQTMHQGLLDSATAAGNTADVQLLQKTNQQWGNMRKIEGAISKDGEGQISPAKLANVMYQKANRYTSVYGKGDTSLADLADAGNNLLPNRTPNSGTPARLMAQFAVPAAIGAGVEGAREGNWTGAAKGAAAGVILPKIIQSGLNSQGAFGALTRGIGTLGKESISPAVLGPGAIQHIPLSSLLGARSRFLPDTSSNPTDTTAEK
jgi:hypothetical protein